MNDFFDAKKVTRRKLAVSMFQKLLIVLCAVSAATYFAVKQDYAGTRGEGRLIKVYTYNKLTGTVCQTTFDGNQSAQRICN